MGWAIGINIRRYLRHWFADDRRRTLDNAALERLGALIHSSEQGHTGEIRICVEARLPNSYLGRPHAMPLIARQRAVAQFGKLRVWDTQDNNGVLIYLLLAERAIEIVADRGLVRRVPAAEFEALVAAMREAFRAGRYEAGLMQAIDQVEALLVQHFPLAACEVNPNELPDRVDLR